MWIMTKAARSRKARKRPPNLDLERIEVIVDVIQKWGGRLTWEALCSEIERRIGDKYTRQGLSKHVSIQAAYTAYHIAPAPVRSDKSSKRLNAEERMRRLQLKINGLERVRDALLERFARWAVRAAEAGLTEEYLNQPLPPINRSENW
jgi:hypothetical protein